MTGGPAAVGGVGLPPLSFSRSESTTKRDAGSPIARESSGPSLVRRVSDSIKRQTSKIMDSTRRKSHDEGAEAPQQEDNPANRRGSSDH